MSEKLTTIFTHGPNGKLSISKEGRLFWNDKEIETRKKISLNWWQGVLATLTALGVFLGGLGAFLQGAKSLGWLHIQ